MPINQPSGQIKLTNVSLVRLKKARKRFEVACYQNKVQDYRKGIEKDLDEVLQIHQVFMNVSKGLVANKEDLQKCFGTTNIDEVIEEIMHKGEIQLSEKERQLMLNKVNNEMLTIVSAKCINPVSKKRYPPTMIHKALQELKFSPVINKPAKLQALEAIKLLVSKQIIPIVRAKMKVKVVVSEPSKQSELIEKISRLITSSPGESTNSDSDPWACIGLIDPVNYRDLMTLCDKKGTVQVLDMAVIDNTTHN
ncbi:guanine nucleotide exchange factor SDO1 [Saccharomyces paradoxus]|uniref:Ribosome maturation protein SDO1 n=1 Tax=Saccharomyces paradoxus TaxID=27291 RepID=A0A8B8UVL0_SACPA|nr:Sdo1 [Saccharomyces paradoxus]QHS74768.1 Sdo1 [Saccharomyces paradoxus]